jgi:hypothetical protein
MEFGASPTPVDLAYAAGIVDGEGSIGWYKPKTSKATYRVRFSVAMTDIEGPAHMAALFGGRIYEQGRKTGVGKIIYVWQLTCKDAANALEILKPYLKIKANKAELAINLARRMQTPGCNTRIPLTEAEIAARKFLASALREANFTSNGSIRSRAIMQTEGV